jgi:CubicO group peptidase (beta-lactamase class C family)
MASDTRGWTADGWEGVKEAFDQNFADGVEVGAGFSVYHDGQKKADLWGGIADRDSGKTWTEDTLIPVFSTTKGATAICANRLADRGELDMSEPVVTYWPEFGAEGKQDMPVSYLLSHQGGLAWVDETLTPEEAWAWEPVIRALEAQKPSWDPGTQHGYHAVTYGYLVGEVVKRIAHKSHGTFFHDEVAVPLDLAFWIGLPESQEHRVGRLISMGESLGGSGGGGGEKSAEEEQAAANLAEMMAAFMGPDTPLGKALYAPGGAFVDQDLWNTRAMHAAEVPAANGICDARSLARMYAAVIGEVDGIRLLSPEQLQAATTQQTTGPNTILMGMDIQFGLGFMLRSSVMPLGGPNSFGHFGAGGSMGWADPDVGLAVGYVMNRMDLGLAGDVRSSRLLEACYAAIG